MPAEFLREEEDFEEDTLFDQAGLLTNKIKQKSDIRTSNTAMRITPMKTFALCLAFFGLGLSMAILEPTLLDLQYLANTDVRHISYTITARSAGLILGSIFGFLLFERYNRQFLLFLIMLAMAVMLGALPWCHNLIGYIVILIILGTFMQMLLAGGNVLCLDLWGRQSGPFLQAIHFSLALGLFISPFLCNAILAGKAGVSSTDSPRSLNINNSYALALPASTLFSVQIIPLGKHSRHHRQIDDAILDPNFNNNNNNNTQNETLSITVDVNTTSDINLNDTISTAFNVSFIPTTLQPNVTGSDNVTFGNGTNFELSVTTPEQNTTAKTHKPKPIIIDGARLPAKKDPWNRPKQDDSVPPVVNPKTTSVATSTIIPTNSSVNATTIANTTSVSTTTQQTVMQNSTAAIFTPTTTVEPVVTQLKSDGTTFSSVVNQTIGNLIITTTEKEITTTSGLVTTTEMVQPTTTVTALVTTMSTLAPTSTFTSSTTTAATTASTATSTTSATTTVGTTSTGKQMLVDANEAVSNVSDITNNELIEKDEDVMDDSTEDAINSTTHMKPVTFNNQTDDSQLLLTDLLNKISELGVKKVHIVYAAMSIIVLLTSVVFLSFLCHNPRELRSKQGDVRDRAQQGKFASVMTAIFFIFMLFYSGAELIFSQLYLSLVLQSSVHLLRTRGSLLISVFWGVYTFSRGTSICCTNGFKPATMLLVDFSCCIVSAIILVIFGPQTESILWCSVAVMAIGLSSILPYSLLWLEDYIHISNKTACTIFLGNSIVHFVLSFLYGHPILLSSTVVIYLVLACCVFALLIFGVAWRLATWRGDKYKFSKANVKYQLANQIDDDDDNVEMASGSSGSLYLLNNETSHSNYDNLYVPLKQKKNIWK